MSLKDFQTILDLQTKVGALAFYQKPTPGYPQGRILEASFSRPDVGATSGATVFDKDGNLVELIEDDPDWSFPVSGGCPRLLMRPQAQNLMKPVSGFSTSLLVKSDPSTNDNQRIAQTQFAVTSNGVNQAFGDISIACTAETEYYWWAVFESAGTNDVSFALVDDSSPISIIRYNTDDNSTTAQSGNFSDVAVEDLGNGSYKLSGKLTTAAGQTTIAPRVRILTLGGGSSITANGQIMKVSQIQITEGGVKEDYIPPANTPLTRSANQFIFNDLVTKGVSSSEGFSVYLDLKNYQFIDANNVCSFRDGTTVLFTLSCLGSTSFQVRSGGVNLGTIHDAPAIVTFDGTNVRLYKSSGLIASQAISGEFDNVIMGAASDCSYDVEGMMFTPIVLSESQAIAALS